MTIFAANDLEAADLLAQARERFLTAEPVEPGQVRDTILASPP